jgi:hypothetical protein
MNNDSTETQSVLSITYEVSEYQEQDRQVEVTYTRTSDNYTYKRGVNIPHLEDGSVDETYFEEILEGQLSGVINKYKMGLIEFRDSNDEPVGIASI